MTSREKKFPLSSDKSTHIHTLHLSSHSPLPHLTGQLDGLLGMMERLYKDVGFEVCFEGSERSRLADSRWKRVPDSRKSDVQTPWVFSMGFLLREIPPTYNKNWFFHMPVHTCVAECAWMEGIYATGGHPFLRSVRTLYLLVSQVELP